MLVVSPFKTILGESDVLSNKGDNSSSNCLQNFSHIPCPFLLFDTFLTHLAIMLLPESPGKDSQIMPSYYCQL